MRQIAPFILRLTPPSNNAYANLATAVLHQAVKELNEVELNEWVHSDYCIMWCEISGIRHSEFCKQVQLL